MSGLHDTAKHFGSQMRREDRSLLSYLGKEMSECAVQWSNCL